MAFTVDLALLKQFLNIADSDTSEDVLLQIYVSAAIKELKSITGRYLERAIYLDTIYTRVTEGLFLRETPVDPTVEITLENPPTGGFSTSLGPYDLIPDTGYVRLNLRPFNRLSFLFSFGQPMAFVYVGGYTDLPDILSLSVMYGVQSARSSAKQSNDYGGLVKRLSVYDVGVVDLAVSAGGGTNALRDAIRSQLDGTEFDSASISGVQQHTRYLGPVV